MTNELFDKVKPNLSMSQELISNARGLMEGYSDSPAAGQALRYLNEVQGHLGVIFEAVHGGDFKTIIWLDTDGQEVGTDRVLMEATNDNQVES